jgi:hypothetical protein
VNSDLIAIKEKDGGKQKLSFGLLFGLKCYKAKPRKLGPNSKIFDYIKELEIIKTNRLLLMSGCIFGIKFTRIFK